MEGINRHSTMDAFSSHDSLNLTSTHRVDKKETLQTVTQFSSMPDHFTNLFSILMSIHHEPCCPGGKMVRLIIHFMGSTVAADPEVLKREMDFSCSRKSAREKLSFLALTEEGENISTSKACLSLAKKQALLRYDMEA